MDQPSMLRQISPYILAKFECDNPAGSHKIRAARHIINCGLVSGDIIIGKTTIIEKSGGNFGLGLVLVCSELKIPLELAVGLSFSKVKRHYLQALGAKLIGIDMLEAGKTPRQVIEWHLERATQLGKDYYYTDQFTNLANIEAHEKETAPEIAAQLKKYPEIDTIFFVSAAGTGASLTGISRGLSMAGYKMEVVLVEPAGYDSRNGIFIDHKFEGTAVGIIPPLLDWSLIGQTQNVTNDEMLACQRDFAKSHGFFIGNSSAAVLSVAKKMENNLQPNQRILILFYDHGLWYYQS